MTFYETYSASNEAHMFLFTYIRNGSYGKSYRLRNAVLSKALSSTPDARARDEGVPNPWFTGPPKKLLNSINNLFTFCSPCCRIVKRYPNSPQKYKHFLRFGY